MANSNDKPLSAAAQKAAVQAEMNESRLSLDEIELQHPYLADGVAVLRDEARSKEKPKRARGGAIQPIPRVKRRTIL